MRTRHRIFCEEDSPLYAGRNRYTAVLQPLTTVCRCTAALFSCLTLLLSRTTLATLDVGPPSIQGGPSASEIGCNIITAVCDPCVSTRHTTHGTRRGGFVKRREEGGGYQGKTLLVVVGQNNLCLLLWKRSRRRSCEATLIAFESTPSTRCGVRLQTLVCHKARCMGGCTKAYDSRLEMGSMMEDPRIFRTPRWSRFQPRTAVCRISSLI